MGWSSECLFWAILIVLLVIRNCVKNRSVLRTLWTLRRSLISVSHLTRPSPTRQGKMQCCRKNSVTPSERKKLYINLYKRFTHSYYQRNRIPTTRSYNVILKFARQDQELKIPVSKLNLNKLSTLNSRYPHSSLWNLISANPNNNNVLFFKNATWTGKIY